MLYREYLGLRCSLLNVALLPYMHIVHAYIMAYYSYIHINICKQYNTSILTTLFSLCGHARACRNY